jgi:ankyrin repeat protein
MNVLLIYYVFLAFTSASTNIFPVSVSEEEYEPSRIPSLYEMILASVMDKLPETSDYTAIQLVLELQVDVPLLPGGSNILQFASKYRKVDLMRVAINSRRFDVNAVYDMGFTALHLVCYATENPEMVVDAAKLLVESGANINALDAQNLTPLHYAVEKSNFELVEYFLSVGAQTEFKDSILRLAMRSSTDSRIVKALIKKNPRLLEAFEGFLSFASLKRMVDLMRIAIDSGKFDVNKVDNYGYSSLHWVCAGTGNPQMAVEAAKLLLENGANIEAKDAKNYTPLHVARMESNFGLVEYLKSKGATVSTIMLGITLYY